jgi:hypothetical protein
VKPSGYKTLPLLTRRIIVLFGAAGFLSVIYAIWTQSVFNTTRLVLLLAIAAVTAICKTKFYTGTTISFLTSVVMIAVLCEGLAASLFVALCGVTIQTVVPSKKFIPHRLIFNGGMISVTVTAAWWTHHVLSIIAQSSNDISSELAATVLASLVYFIGNSISVALILATIQIASVFDVWTKHFMSSAPSFVSAGLFAFGLVGLLLRGSLPYQLLSSWLLR